MKPADKSSLKKAAVISLVAALAGAGGWASVVSAAAPPFPMPKKGLNQFNVTKAKAKPANKSSLPSSKTGGSYGVGNVRLIGIRTTKLGKLDSIAVRRGSDIEAYKGCGVDLAGLPHIVKALRNSSMTVTFTMKNTCLEWIEVN